MTGWTDMPAAVATDWTDHAWRVQFAKAVCERMRAIGLPAWTGSTVTDPATFAAQADDGLDAAFLELPYYGVHWLQQQVYRLISWYVLPAYYTAMTDSPRGYSLTAFLTAIGIDGAGLPACDAVATQTPKYLAAGDKCAVLAGASGDFAGHNSELATWDGDAWSFSRPADGYKVANYGKRYDYPTGGHQHRQIATEATGQFYERDVAGGTWVKVELGWTRKFPMEIETLDDEGEDDDLARLKGNVADRFRPYDTGWSQYYPVGKILDTPPAVPQHGDSGEPYCYGVAAGATGAWAGHDGEIAIMPGDLAYWDGTTWLIYVGAVESEWDGTWAFITPDDGDLVWFSGPVAWIADRTAESWVRCGSICKSTTGRWAYEPSATRPDTVTAYGSARDGDYIGGWLFNELKAGIDLLTTVIAVPFEDTHWGGDWSFKSVSEDFAADWPTAKAAAEAAWTAAGAPEAGTAGWATWTFPSGPPDAYNWGARSPGVDYAAGLSRGTKQSQLVSGSGGGIAINANVRAYAIGEPTQYDSQDFSAQGDGLDDGTAVVWWTAAAVDMTAGHVVTDMFAEAAADTMPNNPWVVEPVYPTPLATGYRIKQVFATFDYAVEGGFEFVLGG